MDDVCLFSLYLMQSGICFLSQGIFSPVATAAGAQTFGECQQPGEEIQMMGCRTSVPGAGLNNPCGSFHSVILQ